MPTNIKNDRPLYEPLGALFDMGASAARGVSRGAVGLPGDLESLARLGLNKVGVPVSLESTLYNSNDLDKMWPKVTPLVADMSPMDELSAYLAPNIYGKAISSGYKGIKTLGGNVVGRDTSTSRRAFLKGTTAIGAGGLLAAKLKFVDDVLKQLPKTEDAAKVASKHKFNSLKEYNDYLNQEAMYRADAQAARYGGSIDDYVKSEKAEIARRSEHEYDYIKNYKDAREATINAYDEARYMEDGIIPWDKLSKETQNSYIEQFQNKLDEFSPQAKAEMKIFKNRFNQFADDVYAPDEPRNFATYLDSYINGETDQYFPAFNDNYLNNKYE